MSYNNPTAGVVTSGGTFIVHDSVTSYGDITVLGKTNSCLYYLTSTEARIATLKRIRLSDISTGCSALPTISSTNNNAIARIGVGTDHLIYTKDTDLFGALSYGGGISAAAVQDSVDYAAAPTYYTNFGGFSLLVNNILNVAKLMTGDFSSNIGLVNLTNLSTMTYSVNMPSDYPNGFCYFDYSTAVATVNPHNYINSAIISNETIVDMNAWSCSGTHANGAKVYNQGNLVKVNPITRTINPIKPLFNLNLSIQQLFPEFSFVANGKFHYAIRRAGTNNVTTSDVDTKTVYFYRYNSTLNTSEQISSYGIVPSSTSARHFSYPDGVDYIIIPAGNYLFIQQRYTNSLVRIPTP